MIAINKDYEDDEFYRYKMPSISIKIETNQTVLNNLVDIGTSLNTKEEYLIKFLSEDLGTNVIVKNKKISLNGIFDKKTIQESIYKFIDNYIICEGCGNPETEMYLKKDYIKTECKACGKKFKILNEYKVSKYIIKELKQKIN